MTFITWTTFYRWTIFGRHSAYQVIVEGRALGKKTNAGLPNNLQLLLGQLLTQAIIVHQDHHYENQNGNVFSHCD